MGWHHAREFIIEKKAFLLLYNPLKQKINRTIKVLLYYTGLTSIANVSGKKGIKKIYKLNRNYEIDLSITIKPEGYTWFVIE